MGTFAILKTGSRLGGKCIILIEAFPSRLLSESCRGLKMFRMFFVLFFFIIEIRVIQSHYSRIVLLYLYKMYSVRWSTYSVAYPGAAVCCPHAPFSVTITMKLQSPSRERAETRLSSTSYSEI